MRKGYIEQKSPYDMTPLEALEIQEKHIAHYGDLYPGGADELRRVVERQTNLDGMNSDLFYPIQFINERIPRGWDIEVLCGLHNEGEE